MNGPRTKSLSIEIEVCISLEIASTDKGSFDRFLFVNFTMFDPVVQVL